LFITQKRKDYVFTYLLIGLVTFFLSFALKKFDIGIGMGLGLFAILELFVTERKP
jgi:hypothetical protein